MKTKPTHISLDKDLIDIIETLIKLEEAKKWLEPQSDEWYIVEEDINEKQKELAIHILWEYKVLQH